MKTLLASLVLLAALHLAPAQTPRPGPGSPRPPFDIHYTPSTNSTPQPPATGDFTIGIMPRTGITLSGNGVTSDAFNSPTVVPEPSTVVFLLTVGLLFSIALMRRKTWGPEL